MRISLCQQLYEFLNWSVGATAGGVEGPVP
jgi:hypothetical protein